MNIRAYNCIHLALLICLFSCNQSTKPDTASSRKIIQETILSRDSSELGSAVFFTYKSVRSYAAGNEQAITLVLSSHSNAYKLISEHMPASIRKGFYNTERGFENDENATLYILDDSQPEGQQLYFLRETGQDSILLQLDQNRHKFAGNDHVLKLIPRK